MRELADWRGSHSQSSCSPFSNPCGTKDGDSCHSSDIIIWRKPESRGLFASDGDSERLGAVSSASYTCVVSEKSIRRTSNVRAIFSRVSADGTVCPFSTRQNVTPKQTCPLLHFAL